MTLTKIKPIAIIGIVGILILIFLIFSVLATQKGNVSKQNPNTTSPPANSIKLQQAKNFDSELTKLKSQLPLKGPNYSVEFSQSLNIVTADIEAKSAQEYLETKTKIEDYIKSKGVDDICSLNIFWLPPKDSSVRKSINAKDLITSNCPVVPHK